MKALVYHGNRDLRLEAVPDPSPKPGEVTLRIDYCGICATDIEEYLYGPVFISGDTPNPLTGKTTPVITGHEITGTVVERGTGVSNVETGDRVVINGVLTCGTCWWCSNGRETQCPSMAVAGFGIDGGLAENMVWPASEVIKLPDNVSSEEAALVEPASVALHAVHRSRLQPGERVAVLGVGTVGMLIMQVAKAMGARVFAVDRRRMSLDMAARLGADETINPESTDAARALLDLTDGVGPDVVVDAAGGKDTPVQAVQWVRRGGRVLLVAIYTAKPEFDFNSVVSTEAELIGSIAYQRRDVEEVVGLISSGAVKTSPLISDKIGLEDVIDKGFSRMMAPSKDVFRILVAPTP
jgi:(R,R)-butanediol dehydrogenase/meso-butanediol dehydrogenase/diacetyl reductase